MAFEKAKKHLEAFGLAERIIVPEHSSATVAEAAEAIGCGRARKGILLLGGTLPARRGRIKTLCVYDTISARFEEAALRSAYVGACFPMIFPEPRPHPSAAAAPGCGDPGLTGFRP